MRITRVYFDIDMRQSFEGLREVAKSTKAEIGNTALNTTIVFINTKRTMFKVLQNNTLIVFYKSPSGRIPIDVLVYLPQNFGGSDMEMNDAIRKSLYAKLQDKGK
jgi:hypothetical protein